MTVTIIKAADLTPQGGREIAKSDASKLKVRDIHAAEAIYQTAARNQALSKMMDQLQSAHSQASSPLAAAQRRAQARLTALSTTAETEGAQNLTTGASSTGALWGRIQPCWRKTPGSSSVAVTLEVAFNSQGGVAKPPRILRDDDDRLDEQRLNAEARAIAALKACAPLADARLSNEVVRVEFRPTN